MSTLKKVNSELQAISIFAVVLAVSSFPACATIGSVLQNGGFETTETIGPSLPSTFGDWEGDGATIVASENGIAPAEGTQMMRFDHTYLGTSSFGRLTSDQYQLIDMSPYAAEISTGQITVTASSKFNRILGNEYTDTKFQLGLSAHSGSPSDFAVLPALTEVTIDLFSDADPSTWEDLTLSLALPEGTTYVNLLLSAHEDVFDNNLYPEFYGHYADAVSFSVIPEPSTAAFLLVGVLVLLRRSCFRANR